MKNIRNIIDKYQNKYPGWLFKWLIRSHWLYPNPKLIRSQVLLSEIMLMQSNLRGMQQEILERLAHELWDSIIENWREYDYTPSYRETTFTVRQSLEDQAMVFTLQVVCTYNPHWSFGQVSAFIKGIEDKFKSVA